MSFVRQKAFRHIACIIRERFIVASVRLGGPEKAEIAWDDTIRRSTVLDLSTSWPALVVGDRSHSSATSKLKLVDRVNGYVSSYPPPSSLLNRQTWRDRESKESRSEFSQWIQRSRTWNVRMEQPSSKTRRVSMCLQNERWPRYWAPGCSDTSNASFHAVAHITNDFDNCLIPWRASNTYIWKIEPLNFSFFSDSTLRMITMMDTDLSTIALTRRIWKEPKSLLWASAIFRSWHALVLQFSTRAHHLLFFFSLSGFA